MAIRLSKKQILDRMSNGEPLRWISGEVTGSGKRHRKLYLGRDMLDRDTSFMVIGMEADGAILETEPYQPEAEYIDYELIAST